MCLASFEDAVRQLREVKNRICRDARGVYMEELAFGNLAFEIHTDPSMPCDWKILLRVDALHEGLYSFKLDMWRRQCQPTHNTDTEPVSVEVDI